MEEIKAPKKERKFLKAVGNIAKVLANELIMGIGRKFIGKAINKVGNKKQGLVIAFLLVAGLSYASIDSIPYPITGNKQRLGFQTSGNGLVWRGLATDTITKPTSYADKNVKAYLVLDSVTGSIYVWKQGAWTSLVGGGSFTQPVDSLFFDTSVSPNNVDTAKMRWDYELGTVVLGMYDAVPNELGFKNFWLVKNQTGSTITKNSLVYASGTLGASGRISVSKFIANGTIDAKLLLGITAHDLSNGEDGYVISFGKIRQVNTDTFADGAILYPSPTTAGVWTDVEPIAPDLDMPIGFCINSSSNNGTIAIRVASGYSLNELHNVAISSPVEKSSLYYSGGLWRDTTAALLVSDTSAMLANYATKAYADTSGRFYARQDFRNVSSSTLTWTQTDTLVVNDTTSLQVYRNGQILLPSQYTVPTNASVVIGSTAYKIGENYTVILPRGGGGGGSGSGSLTSISGGTGILVSPNPITTTGTVSADLSVLMELTDTTLLNLTTRFATKQNNITLTTTGSSGASTLSGDTLNIPQYSGGGSGTVTSVGSGYGLLGGPITTTGTLTVDTSTVYDFVRDSIVAVEIGGDTIKIIKQEYENVTSDTLVFTILPKFPIQLRQFILLFRNGQLLLNDQFSVIDTNKVKVAATSFKLGENYTLVTVSGIGSVSSGQGNPIYPEAGIALSTGTTWTTSITNNSSNWNTAFTDRLKWDGGSTGLVAATGRTSLGGTTVGQSMFTLTNPSAITFPRFNADNSVTALSAANFRTAIGAGTVTTVTVAAGTPISINNNTTTPELTMNAASASVPGYLTSADWTTFNNKQNAINGTGFVKATGTTISYDNSTYLTTTDAASTYLTQSNATSTYTPLTRSISTTAPLQGGGDLSANRTFSITQATTSVNGFLTSTDWNTFNGKQNTISLTTTGTSGAATLVGSTLNIPQYSGGGGGSGTVTSVGLTAPSIFNVGGSPVTTSGTLALTYSGTALPLLNGGTGATTADAALTNLGVTTVGKALLVADNSVSDKFIKVNANKTITLLTAADTRTALGATVRGANTFTLTDNGAISFLRYNADNTVSQRAADGMRSDLGGSTIGQSIFTLTNPSAITFPRFNANNTVSALSAADFRTAIGAGTGNGNGTVTSVTASTPLSSTGGATPNITIANAGVSTTGVVTASTQTFGGAKTFAGDINGSSALNITGFSTLTGGATIGTMATTSSLTHIIGVNSSNAIGEIALGSGLNLSSGTLNLGGFVLATLDFPNTSAQSSSDITVAYTGAAVSHPVMLAIPDGSAPANTNYTAWVSSANTVKIRFNNYSSGSINPASGQFTVFVLNL
jgi:hypothetical protein